MVSSKKVCFRAPSGVAGRFNIGDPSSFKRSRRASVEISAPVIELPPHYKERTVSSALLGHATCSNVTHACEFSFDRAWYFRWGSRARGESRSILCDHRLWQRDDRVWAGRWRHGRLRSVATCVSGAWHVEVGACQTVQCGNPASMTCPSSDLCSVSVGGTLFVQCIENKCGKGPITCECAGACSNCSITGSVNRGVSLTCNTCASPTCA